MTITDSHFSDTPHTTVDALTRAARLWPDATAVVDDQWAGRQVRLTWSELFHQVRRCAAGLVAQGIAPGDRVAIWAPNSYHWPIAALAVHYLGGVLVPLNTRYTAPEALDILVRTQATGLIVVGTFLGTDRLAALTDASDGGLRAATSIVGGVRIALDSDDSSSELLPAWQNLLDSATDELLEAVDEYANNVAPEDLSDILFTSGTTGKSKGVLAEHRHTVAGARAWAHNGRVNADDRYLMVNPYFHTFGYKAGIVVCLLTGASMHPLAVYSTGAAMNLIERDQITVFPGAPTIFQTILDDPERPGRDLSSLRLGVTGASIVPVVLVERMQSDLGFDTVVTAYGLSETSGFVTTCTPDDDDHTVATTCGRPFQGMEISLSEQGEVLARGDMVMRGYLDDAEATSAAIDSDGWLHTGDIGTIDDAGNLSITDRLKDMYIAGGFNVYPAEVEQVLSRIDGVTEAAVIGVPDARLGEVGKAFLTVRDGADVTAEQVLEYCKGQLANFKVPRSVVIVDEFPRNPSGKILKRELS